MTTFSAAVTSDEIVSTLPIALHLDDSDTPSDVIDALALSAFTAGNQPWAHTVHLEDVRSEAPLVPSASRVLRTAVSDGRERRLVVGEGWTLLVVRWRGRSAELTVTAATDELAQTVLAEAIQDATEPKPAEDESVAEIGFWRIASMRGAVRDGRTITVPAWPAIRHNYASDAALALDRVMAMRAAHVDGRLLLLHGPPGTGKTTALRALTRQWREWCQVDCVLDPERLLADPGYLMEVAVGEEADGEPRRWRLLVLEDCDELIRGDAKSAAGQSLSRLLNLSDGLLGQGRDVLVAITTNEDLARLHPAVVRPGRCLAQIEVGALPYAQAVRWLGRSDGIGPGGATLAELYALRRGTAIPAPRMPIRVGAYL